MAESEKPINRVGKFITEKTIIMDEFIGIIKLFAGNFAPKGWMFCDGSLISISSNSALFSILGTTYGGDGVRTFALPNLKGRMALGAGNAITGKNYPLGIVAGSEQTTLLAQNMPSMASGFQLKVANKNATTSTPSATTSVAITGTLNGRDFTAIPSFIDNVDPDTVVNPKSVSYIGQSLPVDNMPPYLGLNYIICVEGIYPSRN